MAIDVRAADFNPTFRESQKPENAAWHAMCQKFVEPAECWKRYRDFIDDMIRTCDPKNVARAMHAAQDFAVHGMGEYGAGPGAVGIPHIIRDFFPSRSQNAAAIAATQQLWQRYQRDCPCR
jgi:hypothetical protein